jgi:small ligand-binding sensory domain FIST
LLREGNNAPQSLLNLLDGEAHIAFPVPGSDRNDYLVRNIMALDPENGLIAVGEYIEDGQKIMFVYRDDETVRADLSSTLVSLQKRVVHDTGTFAPKAALYVSCVARANTSFGDNRQPGGEMKLIKDILGDIPLAGFYANGEISNNRIYGYTGVLTLFL